MSANIRPLMPADLPRLAQIDPNYIADTELVLEREQDGLNVTFRLTERPRQFSYVKRHGYDLGPGFQRDLAGRIAQGNGLYLAAEAEGRLVGFLVVEHDAWRPTSVIEWVVIDRPWRGKGIGRQLIQRTIGWAQSQGLRAVMLETQNTNIDACRFYLRVGFTLSGVQHPYYFDARVAEERAIFWTYELDG